MHRQKSGLFLVAAALCLLLTACGGGQAKAFDPAGTAQALLDSGAFSQPLEAMEQETACLLYGLEESTVTGCAVYGSLTAGAEEIAVLTLTDEAAAETALTALTQRVADQTEALRDYQPEEVAKLEGAIVERRGSSVLLVVAAEQESAKSALAGLSA